MPLLKLDRLCDGLEDGDWAGFLRDWDRTLRAGNHPETTRYNYLLAAAQLAKYLATESPDPDANDAASRPGFDGDIEQTRGLTLHQTRGLTGCRSSPAKW